MDRSSSATRSLPPSPAALRTSLPLVRSERPTRIELSPCRFSSHLWRRWHAALRDSLACVYSDSGNPILCLVSLHLSSTDFLDRRRTPLARPDSRSPARRPSLPAKSSAPPPPALASRLVRAGLFAHASRHRPTSRHRRRLLLAIQPPGLPRCLRQQLPVSD